MYGILLTSSIGIETSGGTGEMTTGNVSTQGCISIGSRDPIEPSLAASYGLNERSEFEPGREGEQETLGH